MQEKNMTALVSCFARCYHYKNNEVRIYSDELAEKVLTKEEYDLISLNMTEGIKFFNPDFKGNKEEILKYIVDSQLSPSVLGRSAFCEKMLKSEMMLGCKQYLIYAGGYDTSAYKNEFKKLSVFEIDREEMIKDKINRLKNSDSDFSNIKYVSCDFTDKDWISYVLSCGYNRNEKSFNSLLGISYYLSKEDFFNMIKSISGVICEGSSVIFDYPTYEESKESINNEILAQGANEEMKSKYSYEIIEKILSDNDLYIYEHLDNNQMTKQYFNDYNIFNPDNKMFAPKGAAYCYAVKK